jgi:hypothetical protein
MTRRKRKAEMSDDQSQWLVAPGPDREERQYHVIVGQAFANLQVLIGDDPPLIGYLRRYAAPECGHLGGDDRLHRSGDGGVVGRPAGCGPVQGLFPAEEGGIGGLIPRQQRQKPRPRSGPRSASIAPAPGRSK